MKNIETINNTSVSKLELIGSDLAEAYKVAFAGSPWFEVSRCANTACRVQYQEFAIDCACPECGDNLIEAYTTEDLVSAWQDMIKNDNATMEVAFADQVPVRATIARPTDPIELFERKYAQVLEMKQWVTENLPDEFVWIEDTFANRNIVPTGNLRGRGATLGRIATTYSGLQVVTRTLAPAVVRSTLRDVGECTDVYLGLDRAGIGELAGARNVGTVPDNRTLLRIDGSEMTR